MINYIEMEDALIEEKVVNYNKYASEVVLQKWPQCFIIGKKVSKDKAMQVLEKLDEAFITTSSNDKEWYKKRNTLLGVKDISYTTDISSIYKKNFPNYNYIKLNCLNTYMGDSCYIGGPYGWMHPSGFIWNTFNIGRWPMLNEILADTLVIASQFPFIEMIIVLMNDACEEPNRHPEIGIKVNKGKVILLSSKEAIKIANDYLQEEKNVIHEKPMDFKTAIDEHYYYKNNHPFTLRMMSKILEKCK